MRRSRFPAAIWRSLLIALLSPILVLPLGSVSAAEGDRDEPVEMGETGSFGDWEIVVDDYEADATETVMGIYEFNEVPKDGFQYALATFEITNTGDMPMDPAIDLTISVVGESLVGYSTFSSWCYLEEDLYLVGELDEGDSATFQMCWLLSEEDAGSLVANVSGFFTEEEDPLWLSLGNDFTVPVEAPVLDADVVEVSTTGDAVPAGEWGQVGDLLVAVDAVKIDAYENLQTFDPSFAAPASGDTYVLVRLNTMYVGEDNGSPAGDLGLMVLDSDGESYDTWENGCGGYIPNDIASAPDLYPGGEAGFNVCIAVPETEATSLVLEVTSYVAFDAEPMYFSIAD